MIVVYFVELFKGKLLNLLFLFISSIFTFNIFNIFFFSQFLSVPYFLFLILILKLYRFLLLFVAFDILCFYSLFNSVILFLSTLWSKLLIIFSLLSLGIPFFVISFFLIYLFIYLFLTVLGLRFCARAFSSCGERGPLFITVRGPLTVTASPVAEHRLQTRRLSSCGSSA